MRPSFFIPHSFLHINYPVGLFPRPQFAMPGWGIPFSELSCLTSLHILQFIELGKMKNTAGVKRLLKAKADVNGQNEDGVSCLHNASAKGLENTIKILLKAGADPTIQDGVSF
jgi:hypothetical protein